MPSRTSKAGSELFIVDNSDADWKVLRYLHDWCQLSEAIDIATGYFEVGRAVRPCHPGRACGRRATGPGSRPRAAWGPRQ
jgi:hypothetical protein